MGVLVSLEILSSSLGKKLRFLLSGETAILWYYIFWMLHEHLHH